MNWRIGTCLSFAAVLAACSTPPMSTPTSVAPVAPASASQSQIKPAEIAGSPMGSSANALARHLDPNDPLSLHRSIYFEFDNATVATSDAKTIEQHSLYLRTNGSLHVVVEGNTDERGGREYNLALGQRRADAVRKALSLYGVNDAQVEAISFGEEKPVATAHEETAWQQNRRADIVYRR